MCAIGHMTTLCQGGPPLENDTQAESYQVMIQCNANGTDKSCILVDVYHLLSRVGPSFTLKAQCYNLSSIFTKSIGCSILNKCFRGACLIYCELVSVKRVSGRLHVEYVSTLLKDSCRCTAHRTLAFIVFLFCFERRSNKHYKLNRFLMMGYSLQAI